ncbi:MAG TPA: hypothetical protein DCE42_19450 [Myxococcales bacterium]|nr:hypothetical protein [Deltaproteobacteria bacterium]HAA56951.1 hypothetical protein [Myxococcales bacterium]|tara:strand:+ start:27184 stop:27630 length:447 start_codon:yes stop_codon:yes gene_type:complete
MWRRILAGVLGVVMAFSTVAVIEAISHFIYPPPAKLDLNDMKQLQAFIKTLPVGAFVFVMVSWWLAILFGSVLAAVIAKENVKRYAWIVGGFVLVASVMNVAMIPHPTWFLVVSMVGIVASTLLSVRFLARLERERIRGQRVFWGSFG